LAEVFGGGDSLVELAAGHQGQPHALSPGQPLGRSQRRVGAAVGQVGQDRANPAALFAVERALVEPAEKGGTGWPS
jgi:hypothetical protein